MYKILTREDLVPTIHLFKIAAPAVARKAQAGQFIIVRIDETGERIPLTIADWDREEGSITIVFMEVGRETCILGTLQAGDVIADCTDVCGFCCPCDLYVIFSPGSH